MKRFQAAIVAGGIFALIGLSLLFVGAGLAPNPAANSKQVTIPPGAAYYYYIKYRISAGMQFTVEFTATGGTVDAHIFNEAQYQTYAQYLSGSGLASTSGASGRLDVVIPAEGFYYVAFDHGAGYEDVSQDVHATIRTGSGGITSVSPGLAGAGIGLIIAGIATSVVARRRMKRAESAMPFPPRPSNVVMYGSNPPTNVAPFEEPRLPPP